MGSAVLQFALVPYRWWWVLAWWFKFTRLNPARKFPAGLTGEVSPAGSVGNEANGVMFAGRPRRADSRACLTAVADAFNSSSSFEFAVVVEILDIDIRLGGNQHHLIRPAAGAKHLAYLRRKRYDALITAPPCETHTRAKHSN